MLNDITMAIEFGADGIVSGALTREGEINKEITQKLIKESKHLPFTFHRAFDMCANLDLALSQLVDLGVTRILTSGGKQTAEQGNENLSRLCYKANNQIIIMPRAGIHKNNIKRIANSTRAKEFHFSGRRAKPSEMIYFNREINMGAETVPSEYEIFNSNTEIIRETMT